MTTDLVEKCARALCVANDLDPDAPQVVGDASSGKFWEFHVNEALAVIDALADGVSPRMAGAFNDAFEDPSLPDATTNEQAVCIGIAAAIRAAKSRDG